MSQLQLITVHDIPFIKNSSLRVVLLNNKQTTWCDIIT